MAAQFIGTSMPAAFAGSITRGAFDCTVESKFNDGSITAYGGAVKLNSDGTVAACTATTDTVYGFVVREFSQLDTDGNPSMNLVGVLVRGYIAVKSAGTPAAGGQVYLAADGSITADSTSTTAIPNATFTGAADAEGIAEVRYNI
jgi:hypothetical protein